MTLCLIGLAFVLMALFDVPSMVRNKEWKNLVVYSVIFLFVLTIGVLISFSVEIPSPIKAIQFFYENILHLSFKS